MTTKEKNEVTTDVTLKIDEIPYIEMMKYAHAFSPDECSGTGLVERIDYNDGSVEFNVKKVYLPNQNNTAGTTDIPEEEMAKVNGQVVMDGDDTELHKFHWHSHVDMTVFHSGTDDSNYDDMQTGDYAISLVVNKKYDMLASVHLYKPLRINILNIEVEAPDLDLDDDDYQVPTWLQKKLNKNVKEVKKWEKENPPVSKVITPYYNNNYNKHGRNAYGYAEQDFGEGLANDDVMEALLEAGEKEGLIMLFKDDAQRIVGYMNLTTQTCYELISYVDYCSPHGYGGNV